MSSSSSSIKKYTIPTRFKPVRSKEETKVKSPYSIGDILVSQPSKAGCSSYSVFGEITKITSTGKYRVTFLDFFVVKNSTHNYGDTNSRMNTFREIKPILGEYSSESVLCSLVEDEDNESYLHVGGKTSFNVWLRYDPTKVYGIYEDIGD